MAALETIRARDNQKQTDTSRLTVVKACLVTSVQHVVTAMRHRYLLASQFYAMNRIPGVVTSMQSSMESI